MAVFQRQSASVQVSSSVWRNTAEYTRRQCASQRLLHILKSRSDVCDVSRLARSVRKRFLEPVSCLCSAHLPFLYEIGEVLPAWPLPHRPQLPIERPAAPLSPRLVVKPEV